MKIHFALASTREFYREGRRTPGYRLRDFLHGYIYGRWVYLYISIAKGEHPLPRAFSLVAETVKSIFPRRPVIHASPELPEKSGRRTIADRYHGKVVTLEGARQLVTVHRDVTIRDLERVVPFAHARDIVLRNPDHIVALECPCRAARPGHCLPSDVCLVVGEPFASFVIDHQPGRSRRITQAEAVEILKAEDARGHVHHAFFKDAMLGRFYAICNCCACCCGALHAHRHGTPMLASSGYVAVVDESLCSACGNCVSTCQFGALEHPGEIQRVNLALCMGCGVCVGRCPGGALSLERDPSRGVPLEITALMEKAAVAERL